MCRLASQRTWITQPYSNHLMRDLLRRDARCYLSRSAVGGRAGITSVESSDGSPPIASRKISSSVKAMPAFTALAQSIASKLARCSSRVVICPDRRASLIACASAPPERAGRRDSAGRQACNSRTSVTNGDGALYFCLCALLWGDRFFWQFWSTAEPTASNSLPCENPHLFYFPAPAGWTCRRWKTSRECPQYTGVVLPFLFLESDLS